MIVIWTIVAGLLISHCGAEKGLTDKNDKWRKNDVILKQIDDFYLHLALYTEDNSNHEKRFYSVASLALYFFAKSNVTNEARRVDDAANMAKQYLNRTSDVIAGPMRALVVYLNSLVQQPMTDVKASCTPKTEQTDCDIKLDETHERNERKCKGYSKNIELYNLLVENKDIGPRKRFLRDLKLSSIGNDKAAIAWFRAASVLHKEIFKFMRNLFDKLLHDTYPCRYPLILEEN